MVKKEEEEKSEESLIEALGIDRGVAEEALITLVSAAIREPEEFGAEHVILLLESLGLEKFWDAIEEIVNEDEDESLDDPEPEGG